MGQILCCGITTPTNDFEELLVPLMDSSSNMHEDEESIITPSPSFYPFMTGSMPRLEHQERET